MFRVLNCLANEHDWRLVALAGAVCFVASLAAISLFHRTRASNGRARAMWVAGAGGAAGCGVWATHFIAMLAYEPGVVVGYDIQLTVLSLIAAILVTAAGLAVASGTGARSAPLGGAIVGAGVAVMHYTGMAALDVPGLLTWTPELVFASIVLGVILATAALTVAARSQAIPATLLAVVLLTVAILSHHIVAMGAVAIVPDLARVVNALAFSEVMLAITIACVTLAVLAVSSVGAILDQRLAQKNALLDIALNTMTHGLMMFDAAGRVILCNQRYLALYGVRPELIRSGMTLRDVIDARIAAGAFNLDPDQYCADVLRAQAHGKTAKTLVEMEDGRTIAVLGEPTIGGGWVATHLDITETKRAEDELRNTREFLNTVIESVPLTITVKNAADGTYALINRACEEQFGATRENVVGKTVHELLSKVDADVTAARDRDLILKNCEQFVESTPTMTAKGMRLLSSLRVPIKGSNGEPRYILAVLSDITERQRQEDELRRTRAFLDTIVDNTPAILSVKDTESLRYVLVNRAAEQFFGISRDEMVGKRADEIFPSNSSEILHAHDVQAIQSGTMQTLSEHQVDTPRNGRRLFASKKIVVPAEGDEPGVLITLSEDVTDRKRAEEKIAHLVYHDPLTDLPNRAAFNENLAAVFARAAASAAKEPFAILSIDLDRFKEVNDVFGHAAGDALLCEVSRRMCAAASGAFLARTGGDEFVLVAAVDARSAQTLAEALAEAMTHDFLVLGHRLRVGLSIGVAVYPSDGRQADTLLANADAALHRAKAESRGSIRFFEAAMDERLRERRTLQNELRAAIEHGDLILHYQPQARIGGEIIGFEALVRWKHPTRGMIQPNAFIALAEENGLIAAMGEWILREACREAASWQRPLQIAVNLSPIQFLHGDLPALVHEILLDTGLAPERLELEITEGVLIGDFSRAVSILRRLKALGARIAMDDFGTGYSSLSYLQAFPFDKIKIDRTFITNLVSNQNSAAIVRAVIGLSRGLNIPVIAEGVETAEQLAILARESCDEVQGYFIGRPQPIGHYAKVVGRAGAPKLRLVAGA